ncbi:MAG TPA: hypothetical protein VE090_02680 [Methylomirabilota bacterium]|nr:hypothetical protein [Methylomirabilota bacterium]
MAIETGRTGTPERGSSAVSELRSGSGPKDLRHSIPHTDILKQGPTPLTEEQVGKRRRIIGISAGTATLGVVLGVTLGAGENAPQATFEPPIQPERSTSSLNWQDVPHTIRTDNSGNPIFPVYPRR